MARRGDLNGWWWFGIVVVAILRASGTMEFNPPPETTILGGDQLVALGRAENLRELAAAAADPIIGPATDRPSGP